MSEMAIYNKTKVLIAEKELRENRKLSYKIIADESGVPLSVLTLYTAQKVRRFDSQTLEKLCRYFGVQPGDMLVLSEDPPAARKENSKKTKK